MQCSILSERGRITKPRHLAENTWSMTCALSNGSRRSSERYEKRRNFAFPCKSVHLSCAISH